MRKKLLTADFANIIEDARKNLDAMEQGKNKLLKCVGEPEVNSGGMLRARPLHLLL